MIEPGLQEVKNISAKDLGSQKVFIKIDSLADQYYQEFYIGEARDLRQILLSLIEEGNLVDDDTKMYNKYQTVINKLSWVAVAVLADQDVENLFKTKLLYGAELSTEEFATSLVDRFKGYFAINFGDFNIQDRKRLNILEAVKANEEEMGSQPITIEETNEELQPLVKNWLRDYDQSSKLEQRKDKLSLLEYMNVNKNVRQLSSQEKVSLRQILELYDYLRFLTAKPSVEETGHRLPSQALISPEEITSSDETEINSEVEAEVLAAYQGDPKQQKAITKELQKIETKFKTDNQAIRNEFFSAVQKKNVNRTIAILRILAERDDLVDFISQDQKLNNFLTSIWAKQYGQEFVAEFAKNPGELKFVRMFLRYVLEQRLGLDTNGAARIGLQIANIFVSLGKKSYNKMAYFDVKDKIFKWME